MIGQTISHYKILSKLGEGGMGVVYEAHDTELDRTVALKFLPRGLTADESEQARFMQEAKAASALNHPNICAIHSLGEHEGERFIDMEFVDGKTLRSRIAEGKLRIADAVAYAIQIAEALQEAHTHGIVHRDIKAENIMVNSKNQVKVMDFGLAKLKGSLKLTKTSSTIGTLAYMSPEQIEGGEADARSDIFSLGVVLFEMLTGHLPFRGEHEAAMMYAIVNEDPEPLQSYVPDAPSELLHILGRALEKNREERYQTVHEMVIDLRRLKKDSTRISRDAYDAAKAAGVVLPAVEGKGNRRRGLIMASATVAVLCIVAVLLLVLKTPVPRLNPNRTSAALRIPFDRINYPSLSRDGNWVAFPGRDADLTWDVYWMNTATGKPSRITDEFANWIGSVDISPDAGQVVYECRHQPTDRMKVKIVASQGGGSRTLTDIGEFPKWRPDGSRIGYTRGLSQGAPPSVSDRLEVWSVKLDGTDSRLELVDTAAGRGANFAFDWSPDGRSIAWTRNHTRENGDVMVRELATGKERQLTFDNTTVDEVIWATNDQIFFVSTKLGQPNLWVISAGGGEASQVTQGSVPILAGRISADTKSLLYMHQEWFGHIWVTGIDGGNARQVTFDDARVFGASISPDGKHIATALGDVNIFNEEAHLYVMDRDGKNQRQLTSGSMAAWNCRWSPDGQWLSYSVRTLGEPVDSARICLIQPFNPAPPRVLCKGRNMWWLDNERMLVFGGMRTLLYSTRGSSPTQVYQDSTYAVPLPGNRKLTFMDQRKGREGFWTVSIDSLGRQEGEPKRGPTLGVDWTASCDMRFIVYRKAEGNDLWRRWLLTGREERIGKALPGQANMWDISVDEKEILWVKRGYRSKLVLVKNVFE